MQSFLFELQEYSSTIALGLQGIDFLQALFKPRASKKVFLQVPQRQVL